MNISHKRIKIGLTIVLLSFNVNVDVTKYVCTVLIIAKTKDQILVTFTGLAVS